MTSYLWPTYVYGVQLNGAAYEIAILVVIYRLCWTGLYLFCNACSVLVL